MAKTYVVEFPTETVDLIDRLGKQTSLTREQVISKAIGLFQIWAEAKAHQRVLVERPATARGQEHQGEEYEIDLGA